MSAEPLNTQSLVFTQSAAQKVYALIQEEGNPKLMLRVFITGGGCSGFQYGFSFDEAMNDDDMVIEKTVEDDDDEGGSGDGSGSMTMASSGTVKLLIDAMSFQYLKGAEIDYREDINGAQFVIRNPNAKTTCGCGSSFSA